MISVILLTHNHADVLPGTLSALIPAVLEGLLVEVILVDGGSNDATRAIADAMGCVWVPCSGRINDRLRAGVHIARAPFLLFLPPWLQPSTSFAAALNDFVSSVARSGHHDAAVFRSHPERGVGSNPGLRGIVDWVWHVKHRHCHRAVLVSTAYLAASQGIPDGERPMDVFVKQLNRRRHVRWYPSTMLVAMLRNGANGSDRLSDRD